MGLSKAFLVTKQDVSKSKLPKQTNPSKAHVHTLTPLHTHSCPQNDPQTSESCQMKLLVNFTAFSNQGKPAQSNINTWAGKTIFRILGSNYPFLPWVMASTWLISSVLR